MHTTNNWGLELITSDLESRGWVATFKAPFDPYLEMVPCAGKTRLVIRSSDFDGITTATDVYAKGKDLVQILNTSMVGFTPAVPGAVANFEGEDGPKFTHIIEGTCVAFSSAFGIAEVIIRDKDGNIIEVPPSASRQQEWIKAAKTNSYIQAAMMHLSGDPDWVELYKAFEALRASKLAVDAISNNDKDHIRRTANSEKRHWKKDQNLVPLTIGEAKSLLRKWLSAAVEEASRSHSESS